MNLTHLSMCRCKRGRTKDSVPRVPSALERRQWLRALLPGDPGNSTDWERLRRERMAEQGPPDWDYFTEHDYAELAGGF